ncbi:MAG: hypothetical protein H7317_15960 [Pseudorhodobacter sp.]|nr:hypothetical protein [Pseudorhodobacter sp.]
MTKIAIALALSLAATSAFAQTVAPAVGSDVTNLAPGGTQNVAQGQTVVIAGVGTATAVSIAGALLLILAVASGGGGGGGDGGTTTTSTTTN